MDSFVYMGRPGRVLFGTGKVQQVAAEAERLAVSRVLVVATAAQENDARRIAALLGARCCAVFPGAAMHTPVDVTEEALVVVNNVGADSVVALGGGSAIGLSKAIALRTRLPQIAVPTTYAGSEMTPILGETQGGLKTTQRVPHILPDVTIYDPDLTLGLPVAMSAVSGLNAMAHAVEGLYAQDRNPISSLQALEGLRALKNALPTIMREPSHAQARAEALYGSWLCGTVLGTVGMALHHKLCHTLGGSFGLPHAETHAALLPHTASYNAGAAAGLLAPASDLFGGDLGAGFFEFANGLGVKMALRELGLSQTDLDQATDLVLQNPYWNPRPIEREAIRSMLQRAWEGTTPSRI